MTTVEEIVTPADKTQEIIEEVLADQWISHETSEEAVSSEENQSSSLSVQMV